MTWSTFFVGAAEGARGLTKRQIAALGAAEVVEQESGPFRVLGDLRPAFSRSHMRRSSLIGGSPVCFRRAKPLLTPNCPNKDNRHSSACGPMVVAEHPAESLSALNRVMGRAVTGAGCGSRFSRP